MGQGQDKIAQNLIDLQPTAIIELFLLYFNTVDKENQFIAFHGGAIYNQGITWQGIKYLPIPVETEGFEVHADGKMARPKIRVSNKDYFVTDLLLQNQDLQFAKIIRKRTFVKYLDDINFDGGNPWGEADASAELSNDTYVISQKTAENKTFVEFELTSPLDLENFEMNSRIIMSRYCSWHYRGNGCNYMGPPIETEDGRALLLNQNKINTWANNASFAWTPSTNYVSGDPVFLENKKITISANEDLGIPSGYAKIWYVCQKAHTSSYSNQPSSSNQSEFWSRDGCTKKIDSCKKRFQNADKQILGIQNEAISANFIDFSVIPAEYNFNAIGHLAKKTATTATSNYYLPQNVTNYQTGRPGATVQRNEAWLSALSNPLIDLEFPSSFNIKRIDIYDRPEPSVNFSPATLSFYDEKDSLIATKPNITPDINGLRTQIWGLINEAPTLTKKIRLSAAVAGVNHGLSEILVWKNEDSLGLYNQEILQDQIFEKNYWHLAAFAQFPSGIGNYLQAGQHSILHNLTRGNSTFDGINLYYSQGYSESDGSIIDSSNIYLNLDFKTIERSTSESTALRNAATLGTVTTSTILALPITTNYILYSEYFSWGSNADRWPPTGVTITNNDTALYDGVQVKNPGNLPAASTYFYANGSKLTENLQQGYIYSKPNTLTTSAVSTNNLILQSETFGNSSWVKITDPTTIKPTVLTDQTQAPDLSTTADLLRAGKNQGTVSYDSTTTYTLQSPAPVTTVNNLLIGNNSFSLSATFDAQSIQLINLKSTSTAITNPQNANSSFLIEGDNYSNELVNIGLSDTQLNLIYSSDTLAALSNRQMSDAVITTPKPSFLQNAEANGGRLSCDITSISQSYAISPASNARSISKLGSNARIAYRIMLETASLISANRIRYIAIGFLKNIPYDVVYYSDGTTTINSLNNYDNTNINFNYVIFDIQNGTFENPVNAFADSPQITSTIAQPFATDLNYISRGGYGNWKEIFVEASPNNYLAAPVVFVLNDSKQFKYINSARKQFNFYGQTFHNYLDSDSLSTIKRVKYDTPSARLRQIQWSANFKVKRYIETREALYFSVYIKKFTQNINSKFRLNFGALGLTSICDFTLKSDGSVSVDNSSKGFASSITPIVQTSGLANNWVRIGFKLKFNNQYDLKLLQNSTSSNAPNEIISRQVASLQLLSEQGSLLTEMSIPNNFANYVWGAKLSVENDGDLLPLYSDTQPIISRHGIRQSRGTFQSGSYAASVYAKISSTTQFALSIHPNKSTAANELIISFDLLNKTTNIVQQNAPSTIKINSLLDIKIEQAFSDSDWYLCSVKFDLLTNATDCDFGIYLMENNNIQFIGYDTADSSLPTMYIWGANLQRLSSENAPPIPYVERRLNQGLHGVSQTRNFSEIGTASIFVRPGTRNKIILGVDPSTNGFSKEKYGLFTLTGQGVAQWLDTSAQRSTDGSENSPQIKKFGDWYECFIHYKNGNSSSTLKQCRYGLYFVKDIDGEARYEYPGGDSSYLHVWGAQVHQGNFSYNGSSRKSYITNAGNFSNFESGRKLVLPINPSQLNSIHIECSGGVTSGPVPTNYQDGYIKLSVNDQEVIYVLGSKPIYDTWWSGEWFAIKNLNYSINNNLVFGLNNWEFTSSYTPKTKFVAAEYDITSQIKLGAIAIWTGNNYNFSTRKSYFDRKDSITYSLDLDTSEPAPRTYSEISTIAEMTDNLYAWWDMDLNNNTIIASNNPLKKLNLIGEYNSLIENVSTIFTTTSRGNINQTPKEYLPFGGFPGTDKYG